MIAKSFKSICIHCDIVVLFLIALFIFIIFNSITNMKEGYISSQCASRCKRGDYGLSKQGEEYKNNYDLLDISYNNVFEQYNALLSTTESGFDPTKVWIPTNSLLEQKYNKCIDEIQYNETGFIVDEKQYLQCKPLEADLTNYIFENKKIAEDALLKYAGLEANIDNNNNTLESKVVQDV